MSPDRPPTPPDRGRLFGPLLRHDLTRLARRGLQPRWRAAFAGLLLIALFAGYLRDFPGVGAADLLFGTGRAMETGRAAQFGERFALTFLFIQMLVVVVMTPAVVGGPLAGDGDRAALDALLSSPLTDRELVLGPFAARLTFVSSVVLTGLPVLAVTMLFGGVDPGLLLGGYAVTLLTAFSLGAFALSRSARGDGFGAVLRDSYTAAVGCSLFGLLCGCCVVPAFASPFSALLVMVYGPFGVFDTSKPYGAGVTVAGYALVHGLVGLHYLSRAVGGVRPPAACRTPHFAVPAADPLPEAFRPRELTPPADFARWHEVPLPGPDEDGLAWKERHFGPGRMPTVHEPAYSLLLVVGVTGLTLLVATGLVLIIGVGLRASGEARSGGPAAGAYARLTVACLLSPLVLAVGTAAATSVATERKRGTLDALLTLPGDRRAVLVAKATAIGRRARLVAAGAALAVVMGVLAGGVFPAALVSGPILIGGWVSLGIALGLWLSVRGPTPVRAVTHLLVALVTLALLPLLAGGLIGDLVAGAGTGESDAVGRFVEGLSPAVASVRGVPVKWSDGTEAGWAAVDVLAATASGLYAFAAGAALWWDAVRRFDVEGK